MNHDITSYQFPSSCYDDEIVWLLSTYLEKIWRELKYNDERSFNKEAFFGYLKFKFKMEKSDVMLQPIPGLF